VLGVAVLIIASLGFTWYVENFGNYSATYGSIGRYADCSRSCSCGGILTTPTAPSSLCRRASHCVLH
jgi:hypothetical protein